MYFVSASRECVLLRVCVFGGGGVLSSQRAEITTFSLLKEGSDGALA